MKAKLWLKDGSVFEEVILAAADLKMSGLPLDATKLTKIEETYLYLAAGVKIYRERVVGTIDFNVPGLGGIAKLNLDQIKELLPNP